MAYRRLKAFMGSIKSALSKALDFLRLSNVLYYDGDKPYKKYKGDAGFDLRVYNSVTIPPDSGMNVEVNTRITSRRMWLLLVGRSSMFYKRGLSVNTAIIDRDYTGQLHVYVYNMTKKPVSLSGGERIAQVIPMRLNRVALVSGLYLRHGGRGNNGFGSTGTI